MKRIALPFLLVLSIGSIARPDTPSPAQAPSWPSAPARRLIQGRWATVQARLEWSQLLYVDEVEGMTRVQTRPDPRIEPMLKGGRQCLIEIGQSPFAWTMSAIGRVWADEARAEGSQHLQLVGYSEDAAVPDQPTLARVSVTPQGAVLEGWFTRDKQVRRVILVIAPDRCDLASQPRDVADQNKVDLHVSAPTVRSLLRQHPQEARDLALPLMREIANDKTALAPHAADVYRAFSQVPVDAEMQKRVLDRLREADDLDPRVRQRASADIAAMGRMAVQVAMTVDRSNLSPSAKSVLDELIHKNAEDDRDAAELLRDRYFLQDCAQDPDARIAQAASQRLKLLPK